VEYKVRIVPAKTSAEKENAFRAPRRACRGRPAHPAQPGRTRLSKIRARHEKRMSAAQIKRKKHCPGNGIRVD
jgi:hypothetical protein